MVKFYGIDLNKVLQLPIKRFWLLHQNVDRIQAEQDLRLVKVFAYAQSEDGFKALVEDLQKQMGKVVEIDEARSAMESASFDEEGLLSIAELGKLR